MDELQRGRKSAEPSPVEDTLVTSLLLRNRTCRVLDDRDTVCDCSRSIALLLQRQDC